MGSWIMCADRLPLDADRVLAFRAPQDIAGTRIRGYPIIARCEWARDGERDWAYQFGDTIHTGIEISHWMPLPAPPEARP